MLDKKIKELGDRFLGFENRDGYKVVKALIPVNWKVLSEINDKFEIGFVRDKVNPMITNFIGSTECEYSDVIDLIIKTIRTNTEIELKQVLLNEKIKELVSLFEKNPLDKLERITFSFDKKVKKLINKVNEVADKVQEVKEIEQEKNNDVKE